MRSSLSAQMSQIVLLPFVGWFWMTVYAILVAIPLWVLWTWLGPIYFHFVPPPYQGISLVELTGLIILVNAARNWIKGWFA